MRLVTHKEFISEPTATDGDIADDNCEFVIWPSEVIGIAFERSEVAEAISCLKHDADFYRLTIKKLEESLEEFRKRKSAIKVNAGTKRTKGKP
jgi:hypothetical protein